jgi:hypothetical protein
MLNAHFPRRGTVLGLLSLATHCIKQVYTSFFQRSGRMHVLIKFTLSFKASRACY